MTTQPKALRLADYLAMLKSPPLLEARCELRRQHARIAELEAALNEAQAGLEVAAARNPQKTGFTPSEHKALAIVNDALACSACPVAEGTHKPAQALHAISEPADHIPDAGKMVAADAAMVLPEPFALYDGDKWYANEEAAIYSCANMRKLQKVYTGQQVRALLAAALPPEWVPCVVTYPGQDPEEVAYGPQRMMDRLKKWLDRYFALLAAAPQVQAVAMDAVAEYLEAQDALDNREYHGINSAPYETLIRRRNYARRDLDAAIDAAKAAGEQS